MSKLSKEIEVEVEVEVEVVSTTSDSDELTISRDLWMAILDIHAKYSLPNERPSDTLNRLVEECTCRGV